MSDTETAPVWKKIYHIVSGGNTTITGDIVEEILNLCKQKLLSGLLEYTSYNRQSFQSWKENPGLKEFVADDEMCNFIHLLSRELNLDVSVAWTVICNFLMFDYFGKIDELRLIIRYDTNVKCFIDNVWYFYSGDRMFLLKTLRHIFEKVSDTKHEFYEQFDNFIKSADVTLLWNNLVKIFEILINEIDRDRANMVTNDTMVRWIHRNNREQVEVVTLLVHMIQYCKLDGNELEKILVLFIRHGFTRHPLYPESYMISRPEDLLEVKSAEIGCILAVMERYWRSLGTCKMLSRHVEKNVELLQLQGDNSIVLLAWAILKTSIIETEGAMDYCNSVITELIKKKVFKSLYGILNNTIFSNCKSGDIVVEAVFRLMAELVKICADFSYLFEQEHVCYITAELLKRKGLVVLDYLGPFFQLSMDAFPFIFRPFLEMCKALISLPGRYDVIMRLLKNIPSFLAEIPWNDYRERFNVGETQKLFIDSDLFIIPKGTPVERFRYQQMEFARFIYPFSFFLLMEQFTKSLSVITFEVGKSWYCYDNLTELVQIGFKFIEHILRYYRGDFRSDTILNTLVHRLEIVPTQFCEGPMKNFSFIRLYFKMNVSLVVYNLLDFSEAFPPLMRRKFFSQLSKLEATPKELFNSKIHKESILFQCLKEEEYMDDHSLLIEYLRLIKDLVEKNEYHQEVQMAGIWYLLFVAFPLHHQWSYKDELQMADICKYSIAIFVKVLQKYQVEETDKNYPIFTMCRDAFMFEEVLISSYLSVFYKDKFYLQNRMQLESNWIDGPILEYLENIRLQMVLLLLVHKLRSHIPEKIRCTIDDKITIISKAVSAYMVNPYSTTLRLLACKFLEVLARDENIPLMALLGLDYDQVQRLFLDKLRDPMEDDNVKLHILELISSCIFHQHGMTAAFFNVTRPRRWYSDNKEKTIEADTVTDFMIDYLQNIRKSHEYLRSPLQMAILRVMANLWISGKQHLIKDIIVLDAFWPLLVDPMLIQVYDQAPSVYAYILKILSMQLSKGGAKEKKFVAVVEKFLTNDKLLRLWQKYMLKCFEKGPHSYVSIEEKKLLIDSWIEFVVAVEKERSLNKFKSENIKFLFVEMCLDGIKFGVTNMFCLETWMNLSLVHISNWGLHFTGKDEVLAEKIIRMYAIIKLHYTELNYSSRAAVLTIVQTAFKDLSGYFQTYSLDLLEFLEQIGPLMDYEYVILEEQVWRELNNCGGIARDLMVPWILCINIANCLLKFKTANECSVWFSYHNYLPRIVKCCCDLLNNPETVPLSKIALRSLILYVQSPMAFDFLNVNLTKFYDAVEPPITALLIGHRNRIHTSTLEEGWTICILLMKFNEAILDKFQYMALPSCYSFISLHEQILQHIVCIPETTVALKALNLLINTLKFFDDILGTWQDEWYKKSNNTYKFVVNGTKRIINSCLYIILRPKNIVMYKLDNYYRLNQIDRFPIALMVGIMNRLITAVGLGFSILYRTNPRIAQLMEVYIPDTSSVLIINDFSVPKFELPIPYGLTYGKLLCLAHFMCKTLDALTFGLGPSEDSTRRLEEQYSKCIGLVEHQDPSDNLPHQKLSAFLRYAMYEYSGLADPWIRKLDRHHVKKSLELLMTFLGQQVYLYIHSADAEGLPYYKRNLSSELQFFYEHVKRQTSICLNQQIVASLHSGSSYKSEMDIMKRYLLSCHENNVCDEIFEKNFCLFISHWFTNICHLR